MDAHLIFEIVVIVASIAGAISSYFSMRGRHFGLADLAREPGGDRCVIGRGAGEGLGGEPAAQGELRALASFLDETLTFMTQHAAFPTVRKLCVRKPQVG